jgi:hypothetical protein
MHGSFLEKEMLQAMTFISSLVLLASGSVGWHALLISMVEDDNGKSLNIDVSQLTHTVLQVLVT